MYNINAVYHSYTEEMKRRGYVRDDVFEQDYRVREFGYFGLYTIDQGSPCPLAILNPFGRELLLLDVSTGFKRSTWIQRIL